MPRILAVVYRAKERDFAEKLEEATREDIVYVTDLTSCSQKRVFRLSMPLLSFRFEPAMLLGELVHRGLEAILEEEGWATEMEVVKRFEIDGEVYELRGRVDAALVTEDGVEEVVEIKTARSVEKPLEHHVLQLQVYMTLLGAKRGTLVYVTPDRVVEYAVGPREVDVEQLVRETVHNLARPRFDWECRYCPYRRYCPYVRSQEH
ncbi:CRISPR-associated protein Cas4 [Pyrolobus fumarii]|uniref:CRISPR-associated protein Cas4 n=1 Tax=Pyrolobus fumarii TaxID=54252 RepID=UPI001FCBC589|nr:CRISPR-associated protein Cas4 [Pyrolobus fumarii]